MILDDIRWTSSTYLNSFIYHFSAKKIHKKKTEPQVRGGDRAEGHPAGAAGLLLLQPCGETVITAWW